jgi:hypothetical protein
MKAMRVVRGIAQSLCIVVLEERAMAGIPYRRQLRGDRTGSCFLEIW